MPMIKVPTCALNVDNLRFYSAGYGYGFYGGVYSYGYYSPYTEISDPIILYNTIPEAGETDVPAGAHVRLHIASLDVDGAGFEIPLDPTVRVWLMSDTDNIQHLAYDQAGGGFQPGFNGPESAANYHASPGASVNDELTLVIDPTVDFSPGAEIHVTVEATAAGAILFEEYSFSIVDESPPEIDSILWLDPRRCLVTFDCEMRVSQALGSIRYMVLVLAGLEITSSDTVTLRSQVPSTSWVGYGFHITGSADPRNNRLRTIQGVSVANKTLTLDTGGAAGPMFPDDAVDKDAHGKVRRTRVLRGALCPFSLQARLTAEGASSSELSADRVQCAYEPMPVSLGAPEPEWVPAGIDISQMVLITWYDDVSFGRLYSLVADGVVDTSGNRIAGGPDAPGLDTAAIFDFQSPLFGLPARRKTLWDWLPLSDQEEDLDIGDQQLRKMAVVLQDLFDVIEYRVRSMEHLEDPHRCPVHQLDYLLYDLGNPFDFVLREPEKRKLISVLKTMYDQLGLELGIEYILRYFLGYNFEVIAYYTTLDVWVLGTSTIGYTGPSGAVGGDAILGPGTEYARNSYEIVSPVVLTTEERSRVVQIAQWADPAEMHLVRIVEPGGESGTGGESSYWILGTSLLDASTILAGT